MQEKISIFNMEIEKYKLFGVYLKKRTSIQTQNITTNFKISTLLEKTEYEYSIDFQWVNSTDRDSIVAFIKNNLGKKIQIPRSYFFGYEGGEYVFLDNVMNINLIINLEDIDQTNKNNGFFDIKLKARTFDNYSMSSKTYEFLSNFTYEYLSNKLHSQIEEGVV